MSGALDSLGERGAIVANMDLILNYVKNSKKEADGRQISLFANISSKAGGPSVPPVGGTSGQDLLPPLNLKVTAPTDVKTKLQWEKELLGLYVSSHPFAEVATLLTGRVRSLNEVRAIGREEKIITAGVINTIKKIFTKTNEPMLFVGLEDLNSRLEIIVFPSILKKTNELWVEGRPIVVVGKLSYKDDEAKVLADSAFHFLEETAEEILAAAEKALNNSINKTNNYNKINNGWNGGSSLSPYEGERRREVYNQNLNTSPQPSPSKGGGALPNTYNINQIWIKLPKYFNTEIHLQIKTVFMEYPGDQQVMLTVEQAGLLRKIQTSYKIKYSEALKTRIEEITGEGSVAVK
jgi:DNA polymerase-3 subunit alpha